MSFADSTFDMRLSAVPVLAGAVLQTIEARRLELGFLGFGLCFVFFGALAFWMMLQEKGKARVGG